MPGRKKLGFTKKCEVCGNDFYVPRRRKKTARFCSKKCLYITRSQRMAGNKLPESWKRAIAKGSIGKKHSEKTKKKISADRIKFKISAGKNNPRWIGGKRKNHAGYINLRDIQGQEYKLEHRRVMEKIIGRPLNKFEVVHHINGIKDDNRPENLMLFSCSAEHTKYHTKTQQNAKT